MLFRFLITICFLLSTSAAYTQSDDGWFTHNAECGISVSEGINDPFALYSCIYNFENHFSAGTTIGIFFQQATSIPLLATLKAKMLYHKPATPYTKFSSGWLIPLNNNTKNNLIIHPALGIEVYTPKRIRITFDIGCQIYNISIQDKTQNTTKVFAITSGISI